MPSIDPVRRGSILLFCLALVAALAVLAYGFVRVAQLSRASGDSSNMQLLARETAIAGTHHAIEQIIRDFVNEPLSKMDAPAIRVFASHDAPWGNSNNMASTETGATVTTGGARGINRSDMAAIDAFDKTMQSFSNGSANERMVKEGYMATNGRGRFYEPEFYNLPPTSPTAYDPALTGPESTPLRPNGAIRFATSYASAAPPDRSQGIFYDERLRPVSGAPGIARDKARYRLRYAIVNSDLEGQLLVTGDPAVGHALVSQPDPRSVADRALARIIRNMHKVPAIVDAHEYFSHGEANVRFQRGGASAGVAAEHVFVGRGSADNVDRQRGVNDSSPSTFPLMYRLPDKPGRFGNTSVALGNTDGEWQAPTLFSTSTGTPTVSGSAVGGERMPNVSDVYQHNLVGPQYSFLHWLHATYGNGDEGVNDRGMACFDRYTPFGRGVSAVDHAAGETPSRYRGYTDTPWCVNVLTATPRLVYAMIAGYMPPGAIQLSYARTAPSGYVLAAKPVVPPAVPPPLPYMAGDTTIYVTGGANPIVAGDLVTFNIAKDPATYQVVSSVGNPTTSFVIAAPGLVDNAAFTPDADEHLPGDPVNVVVKATRVYSATRTRDLFVDALSPAFSRYPAPARSSPAIAPDYHVDDFWKLSPVSAITTFRDPANRYPGVLAINGYTGTPAHAAGTADMIGQMQHDSLGYYLRSNKDATSSILSATDAEDARVLAGRYRAVRSRLSTYSELSTHAYKPLWFQASHGNTGGLSPTTPDTNTQLGDSTVAPHQDSIWEAVGQAMAAAVSMVQGQHFLYPTWKSTTANGRTPATWFDGGTWASTGLGSAATTIEALDRLFVTNLGSNFDVPNSPTPVKVWAANSSGTLVSFTPEWNLARLNDANPKCMPPIMATNPALMPTTSLPIYSFEAYTATQRSQVAELIVNDMRMSFFGSSPYYADFRVLDLNGDGKAACSVYQCQKASGDPEHDLGIDQYTTAVDGNGISDPIPASLRQPAGGDNIGRYFSNTGCFYLGKSRFWHVMVRGEVWDNMLNCTVNRAQLDSVVCVDATGLANEVGSGTKDPAKGQCSTHVIYQSWILNGERELMPRRY
ncbi:MAG: hypothetical protein J0M02_07920 [Planctomycetes bacterium]|nr:hypothetical protein [Planctomycetota bacterium]